MDSREASRKPWVVGSTGTPTIEQINMGSLQRIADATEVMAQNYREMERQLKDLRQNRDYWMSQAEAYKLQLRAARSQITKLRKKGATSDV